MIPKRELDKFMARQTAPVVYDLLFKSRHTKEMMQYAIGWRPWWQPVHQAESIRRWSAFRADLEFAIMFGQAQRN